MNIKQIAEAAGVSVATVSRVLNHPENVAPKTREKIQKIIDEEEYTPNWFAQGLNFKRTRTIGLVLPQYINSFFSLKVEDYVDLDTHGMFICTVTEARVVSNKDTMTYTYYQNYVKPKPEATGKKGFVCKICGYVYEGDTLPDDFICPLCKHPASDFEPLK